jgi:hypothetical protein
MEPEIHLALSDAEALKDSMMGTHIKARDAVCNYQPWLQRGCASPPPLAYKEKIILKNSFPYSFSVPDDCQE